MRNNKKYIANSYDTLADNYQSFSKIHGWRGDLLCEEFLSISELSGGKVLDLGCADGYSSKAFFEAGAFQVYGVDLSPELVKRAMEQYQFEDIRIHDLDNTLPYEKNIFNAIISYGVLDFVNDLEKLFCDVRRVLDDNGYFSFTINELIADHSIQNSEEYEIEKDCFFLKRYSDNTIKKMMNSLGFNLLLSRQFEAFKSKKLPEPVIFRHYITRLVTHT